MDLWNTLALTHPSTTTALAIAAGVAAFIFVVLAILQRISGDHSAPAIPFVSCLAFGLITYFTVTAIINNHALEAARERATTAIEAHLLDTYNIRTLDPIKLSFANRTATASGVNAAGKLVTAELTWLSHDTRDQLATLDVADDFNPVTTTITTP